MFHPKTRWRQTVLVARSSWCEAMAWSFQPTLCTPRHLDCYSFSGSRISLTRRYCLPRWFFPLLHHLFLYFIRHSYSSSHTSRNRTVRPRSSYFITSSLPLVDVVAAFTHTLTSTCSSLVFTLSAKVFCRLSCWVSCMVPQCSIGSNNYASV